MGTRCIQRGKKDRHTAREKETDAEEMETRRETDTNGERRSHTEINGRTDRQ